VHVALCITAAQNIILYLDLLTFTAYLQSCIECNAIGSPVCWLEKDGADKVYDLIASFSCIDALVHL
jgi:hypothetical protein